MLTTERWSLSCWIRGSLFTFWKMEKLSCLTLNNSVVRILEDSAFDDVRLAKNQNNLLLIKDEDIYVAKMQ